LVFLLFASAGLVAHAAKVDFNRDIRPIMSDVVSAAMV
jgi:hypothetical protein